MESSKPDSDENSAKEDLVSLFMGAFFEEKEYSIPLSDIEQLIETLQNAPNAQARAEAAYTLGEWKIPWAVEALIDALSDADETVRMKSAIALGNIGDKQAVEPLIDLLRKVSGPGRINFERDNLIDVLADFCDPRAFEPFLEIMDSCDDDTYFSIIQYLGQLRDERAFPYLMKWLKDQNDNIRLAAAKGLGWLGDPRAIPALEWAYNNESFVDEWRTSLKDCAADSIRRIKQRQSDQT